MTRKQVYHAESCKGMVTTNFFVDKQTVEAYFCDGDISSHNVAYRVEKDEKGYKIIETEDMDTPLDDALGKTPSRNKSRRIDAVNEQDALKAMIDYIAGPYDKPSKYSFPVDAKKLRAGLENMLLRSTKKLK